MFHNHLSAHRKHWALSPDELSTLTGIPPADLLDYEAGRATPDLDALLALEVLFGFPPRPFFPRRYAEIERAAVERAAEFSISLEHEENDLVADTKRTLLALMGDRIGSSNAI